MTHHAMNNRSRRASNLAVMIWGALVAALLAALLGPAPSASALTTADAFPVVTAPKAGGPLLTAQAVGRGMFTFTASALQISPMPAYASHEQYVDVTYTLQARSSSATAWTAETSYTTALDLVRPELRWNDYDEWYENVPVTQVLAGHSFPATWAATTAGRQYRLRVSVTWRDRNDQAVLGTRDLFVFKSSELACSGDTTICTVMTSGYADKWIQLKLV